jgi:hypothetical protein
MADAYVADAANSADIQIKNALVSDQIMAATTAASVMGNLCINYRLDGVEAITVNQFPNLLIGALETGTGVGTANEIDGIDLAGPYTITTAERGGQAGIRDRVRYVGTLNFDQQTAQQYGREMGEDIDTVGTALFTNLSNSVGTSGQALTLDDFEEAVYTLENNNAPRTVAREVLLGLVPSGLLGYCSILAPVQARHLSKSARSTAGAQFGNPAIDLMKFENGAAIEGWCYELLGVQVFKSTTCATNGSDREGAVFAGTAFGFAYNDMTMINAAPGSGIEPMPGEGNMVRLETQRDAQNRQNVVAVTTSFGWAEMDDSSGVLVTSSSTY